MDDPPQGDPHLVGDRHPSDLCGQISPIKPRSRRKSDYTSLAIQDDGFGTFVRMPRELIQKDAALEAVLFVFVVCHGGVWLI